jgi:protease-4
MTIPSAPNELNQTEQQALQTLLLEGIKEQRRARRWRIFFRTIWLIVVIIGLYVFWPSHSSDYYKRSSSHVALIKINGSIMPLLSNSSENINKALEAAFAEDNAKAIILDINSPGGSPVQAGQVFDTLLRLRASYPHKKVYAVCEDICASGAYYIAAGTDDIYVDKASLVGSIGVLMNSFGFVDTLQKVGVTRRLFTAGSEKGFLDPFSPLKPTDVDLVQKMLNTIHEQFIDSVKKGRGHRLNLETPLLFSGLVWTGQQAVQIGLADGLASTGDVARNLVKEKNIVDYTEQPGLFSKLTTNVGSEFARSLSAQLGIPANRIE